ncbi:acyl-CoA dehydrogenase family protein [Curvibacter sp. HBC61]|uniref:Acyl-CoA dehydrogenase family protein n=1 Tax=Curvibacter cyanobacteriorum TaxID=3026422 RepID=A0ABT5MXQ4_9BURK|nr:acyl-CoA dehydrogenase family protein [Curvibacter sp. HBC61]MDD0838603.1 acyl-CoA dehydrogenase family protein [Curvibacter sp. HBC61]
MSSSYQPRPADNGFLLFNVLQAPSQLAALSGLTEADEALMTQVLDEAGKFVGEVVAPLSRQGDEIGCRWEAGQVTTPPGFRDAYQAFWQAGWPALACAEEDGGQGLPWVLEGVLYEWLSAANHGWTMAPGLLHGAYECLKHHGHADLKAAYLNRIASGEWLATMCLTEPHAGSDLGLVRTQAVPQDGGRFPGEHRLSGTKIFISGGEHDLSDNIVHLVLARLPGAPAGPKGLSLFLAPKFLPDGSRNGAHCDRIEEKMGLHGSPTCVMRFEDATGWLVGQPGAGLNAMFIMMNAARVHVALQGIGLLDAAWQKADAYARERRQMRAPGARPASRGDGDSADLLIEHPAMRRILDVQRAWIDAGRLLAYRTGLALDQARHHPDATARDAAQRWCSLVTPVLKAAWTHQAFYGASECLQVLGGHGYVREWGIEQIVRDARVSMIYEGTNEIQAIDLLLRKVLPDGGEALGQVLLSLRGSLDAARDFDAEVLRRLAELRYLTTTLALAGGQDAVLASQVADDYLRAVALVLMAWAWAQIAQTPGAESARWQAPLKAFRERVLPELDLRLKLIKLQLPNPNAAHPA